MAEPWTTDQLGYYLSKTVCKFIVMFVRYNDIQNHVL